MNYDKIFHKWLRIPYALNVRVHRNTKKPRATLLLIHGIGSSISAWDKVVMKLPKDVNVIAVDLLGFGLSSRPTWAVYDAKRQAQSVAHSCRIRGITGPMIVVGHSMGSLVGIELARLYPRLVSSLVLCSPPLYTLETGKGIDPSQKMLTSLYATIRSYPDQFVKISQIAAKYKIINRGFRVDEENVHAYMNALEASIVNQTAYNDIKRIRKPISILYGTLDPVIIARNLKALDKEMANVTLRSVPAAHEIKGYYTTAVTKQITEVIEAQTTPKSPKK